MAEPNDWEMNPQYPTYAAQFPPPEYGTQEAQAASEGVVIESHYDTVEFFGEKIRLAEGLSIMPMVAFGNAANKGLDSSDMKGLAAMYSLIRSVIYRPPLLDEHGQRVVDEDGKRLRDESEWNRFQEIAEDEQADGDDVMGFVNRAMEVMSARPPKRREVSSAGSPGTSARSRAVSSSPGRPAPEGLTRVADL